MIMIIVVLGIVSISFGERILINNGFGWDGEIYGTVAQTLDFRSLDTYYIHRIFPSIVVHFALTILHQPLDNKDVVFAFSFLNLGLLLLACVLYRLIAKELGMYRSGFWLGFVGIFVNFAYLKVPWYYPVLTDVAATALSLAMLLFYLRRKQLPLLIVAFFGAYTWPSLICAAVLLLAFPRDPIVDKETYLPKYLAAGLAFFVFTSLVWLCYIRHYGWNDTQAQPIRIALPLSMVLCALYVYLASASLLHGVSARTLMMSFSRRGAAAGVALFIIAAMIPAHLFADHPKYGVNIRSFMADNVMRSVVRPLAFLVAHPVYFGPVFLLFLFCWRPFTEIIRSQTPPAKRVA